MARRRDLIALADECEEAASGLRLFRDDLPRFATRITSAISELYAISSVLREIDLAQSHPHHQPSFHRIHENVRLVVQSLQSTLHHVSNMVDRATNRRRQDIWDDLCYQMETQERLALQDRLRFYNDFLRTQKDVVMGAAPSHSSYQRAQIEALLGAQGLVDAEFLRHAIGDSGARTPRPRPARPRPPSYIQQPILSSPSSPPLWQHESSIPPEAPDVPDPISPGFSSSSTPTLSFSHISFSAARYVPPAGQELIHWAQNVYDGAYPATPFRPEHVIDSRSLCDGDISATALRDLGRDDYAHAVAIPFDRERLWVHLYWRPHDARARILVQTKDHRGNDAHYCTTLNTLKVIRQHSCLQLCKLSRRTDHYDMWAQLNFSLYERMVLFYCTFAAMKKQDEMPVASPYLEDHRELSQHPAGELVRYSGKITDGNLQHKLRLFVDQGSGGVRLEACARRGPMKDVPLWTAFVTKYAEDPNWAWHEGGNAVSLAAIRPPPYVFLLGYTPPRDRQGQYVLQFTDREDASQFIEAWTGLCNSR